MDRRPAGPVLFSARRSCSLRSDLPAGGAVSISKTGSLFPACPLRGAHHDRHKRYILIGLAFAIQRYILVPSYWSDEDNHVWNTHGPAWPA